MEKAVQWYHKLQRPRRRWNYTSINIWLAKWKTVFTLGLVALHPVPTFLLACAHTALNDPSPEYTSVCLSISNFLCGHTGANFTEPTVVEKSSDFHTWLTALVVQVSDLTLTWPTSSNRPGYSPVRTRYTSQINWTLRVEHSQALPSLTP